MHEKLGCSRESARCSGIFIHVVNAYNPQKVVNILHYIEVTLHYVEIFRVA